MKPAFLIFLTALTSYAQVAKGVNSYSRDKESSLGTQLAQSVRQSTKPIDSALTLQYVERIGARLAAQLPEPKFPYTFALIKDDAGGSTHEPLAIPGGTIFVPASLVLTARDDAEFAGMLAHAMAHVAARHYTRTATRGEIAQMAQVPLVFTAANQNAVSTGLLAFHRAFESEADVLAVKMTADAGFDPAALARYIGREQRDDNSVAAPQMPSREARVRAIEQAIAELPAYPARNEFPAIQDEVRRLSAN